MVYDLPIGASSSDTLSCQLIWINPLPDSPDLVQVPTGTGVNEDLNWIADITASRLENTRLGQNRVIDE